MADPMMNVADLAAGITVIHQRRHQGPLPINTRKDVITSEREFLEKMSHPGVQLQGYDSDIEDDRPTGVCWGILDTDSEGASEPEYKIGNN